jgi:hypothetical protein
MKAREKGEKKKKNLVIRIPTCSLTPLSYNRKSKGKPNEAKQEKEHHIR